MIHKAANNSESNRPNALANRSIADVDPSEWGGVLVERDEDGA
jgi:hypothetical protein